MMWRGSVFSFLWTPSRRWVSLPLDGNIDAAAQRIHEALDSSREVTGRVVGRGVKIERHPSRARQRGAFAAVFYGLLRDDGHNCRLTGHFQLHPVGRLFIGVWIGLSTILALAFLVAGFLRASPESSARDALPFILPVLLPFLGLWAAQWLQRRSQDDETAIRRWIEELRDGWSAAKAPAETANPPQVEPVGQPTSNGGGEQPCQQ